MAKNLLVYCANSIVPHKSNYSRATASDLLLATLRGVLFLKDLAKKNCHFKIQSLFPFTVAKCPILANVPCSSRLFYDHVLEYQHCKLSLLMPEGMIIVLGNSYQELSQNEKRVIKVQIAA